MAEIRSFPNNQDEFRGAEEVMKWLHGRSSGVFAAEDNCAVAPLATPGMAVTVSDGTGWIANSNQDGIVWWNEHEAVNTTKLQLPFDAADGVLNRIDRVIVEWKTTNYVDWPEIKVLKGSPSSQAIVPILTNNSTLRQISLAQVYLAAGTTAITASMITDERLDPAVCGLVTENLTLDTGMMQAQFKALLQAVQNELSALEAGTAVELKKLAFYDTAVPEYAFVSDTTYGDYPYRASVTLSGVISSMIPEVIFALTDAVSGNFAPVSDCYDGGVYIYAAEQPTTGITIPTILCWKEG